MNFTELEPSTYRIVIALFVPVCSRKGFNESAARVRSILESEAAKGKEYSRIVVGGFSQGGATALHVCLRSTKKLAGKFLI